MGLDMHLEEKIYVSRYDGDNIAVVNGKEYSNVSYVVRDVMYWRKTNAIHRWFVENVQLGNDDCGLYYVEEEKLLRLVETCKEVLKDHSKAGELLPTCEGFFFGSTEYDEDYFEDLKRTVEGIEKALKEQQGDFYYTSSW